ncbi:MAG TPA: DNA gyrase C-terminal beta-propeller domain-containing protein, partial [Dehalococcoidia bacterium]|nr:DNA gyrase C-terminal beta-propeller domain-containing protein [Dehalococcoidia bacterium]
LVVTEQGFGKRTLVAQYPVHNRGGSGVLTYRLSDRTGNVAAVRLVNGNQELMIISASGIVLRTTVQSIAQQGRSTQGVTVMRVGPGDRVASIEAIDNGEASSSPPSIGSENGNGRGARRRRTRSSDNGAS